MHIVPTIRFGFMQSEEVVKQLTAGFPSTGLLENNRHLFERLIENNSVSENRQTGDKSPTVRFVDFRQRPDGQSPNCFIAVCQFNVRIREADLTETFPELNASPRILVLTDEAHRSQYKLLGANLDKGIPIAAKIGYTGTPIDKTERVFGDYIIYLFMKDCARPTVS